jgi:2'-5' RNA ligase
MARIRTFIAVDLAAGVKDRVIGLQEELGRTAAGVKWVPRQNLHLTLLFLGDVGELDVVKICRVVQARSRKHAPFTVDAAGLGAFPNGRRPKILWVGLTNGVPELRALHADLEEGLLDLGCYRREEREYTPHLTLGRLSHEDRAADWAPVLAKYEEWPGGPSAVDEVLVMSSEMRRDGPEYAVMGRAPLGG